MKKADTGNVAIGEEQDGAGSPVVGSERQPMVRGGGPSSSGAQGGCPGVARPAVASVGAQDAAAWQRSTVR
jgi:hypothetical protein